MPERINPVWTSRDLLDRMLRGEDFFVLDVRNRDEYERFRLEGRRTIAAANVPYFEMLELGGREEMVDSLAAYMEEHLAGQLPMDRPVLAVCAKGDTSEFARQALTRLGRAAATLEGGMREWGDFIATRTLTDSADLAIIQLTRPARGCLSYIVASAGQAAVIDPVRRLEPYLQLARDRGWNITAIIDTHAHADHISGGPALAAQTGAPYYLHPYDAIHPMDLRPATIPYEYMRDGQIFPIGRTELSAIHIPGHTLGLVALRLDDSYLFTGDSIFIRSIARPDLGGKAEAWAPLHARSLRRLLRLPEKIVVLPAHASSLAEADEGGRFAAPLGELRRRNDGLIALAQRDEQGFVRYLLESLPRLVPEYLDIKRVNAGLLTPSEEEAAALEIGKNVCALSQAYAAAEKGGS